MTCSSYHNAQTCISTISHGSFQVGFCGTTAFESLTSATIPGPVTWTDNINWDGSYAPLYAPIIQLNYKISDFLPTSTQTSVVSTENATSTSIFIAADSSSAAQNSLTLTSGDKVAIGVAVPLGVIAVAFSAVTAWLWRHQRRKISIRGSDQRLVVEQEPHRNAESGIEEPAQLEAPAIPQELEAGRKLSITNRHELMNREH